MEVKTYDLSKFMRDLGVASCRFEGDEVVFPIEGMPSWPRDMFYNLPGVYEGDWKRPKRSTPESDDPLDKIPTFGLDVSTAYSIFCRDFYRQTTRRNVTRDGFVAGFRLACLQVHNMLHKNGSCPLCVEGDDKEETDVSRNGK